MTAQDAFALAERFLGVQEVAGTMDNPQIVAMLRLDAAWPESEEVPWCSAFTNYICWLARLPRSKSLAARSWLGVGAAVPLAEAQIGDIVVLSRGSNPANGHVGFYAGMQSDSPTPGAAPVPSVRLLGGNQGNAVSIQAFPVARVIGVRRLV